MKKILYTLYKRHQAAKKWERVGSYRFKRSAERARYEIESANRFMRTMIRKTRSASA